MKIILPTNKTSNKNNEKISDFINDILDDIEKGKFNDIFEEIIEKNESNTKSENNATYIISTVSSQPNNYSQINLYDCESKLKDIYSLDKNEQLILLKVEYDIEQFKIPITEYQLFTKNGTKLDLNYCNKNKLFVSIPVEINEEEEFMHNPNDNFYHDKCYTYTLDNNIDLTLYDKKYNYNENFYALCEKICNYENYIYINKTVNCICKTKSDFPKVTTEKIKIKEFLHQFVNFKKIFTNLYVLSCPKELFCSKGLKKNSGSYINIILITLTIIFSIFFCIKGYNPFKIKINDIIKEKYIINKEENSATENSEMKLNINNFKPELKLDNQNQKNPDSNSNKNNSSNKTNINKANFYNDYELNNLDYSEALEIDKRTFFQSYISFIKTTHILFFTCFIKNDYNSTQIKICLFLFWFSLDYTITTLFFNDSNLHRIYEDKGKYNFLYQLPIAIYSNLISFAITKIVTFFAIFESKISKEAKMKTTETEMRINNYIHSLKCKFAIFFSLIILFLLFFWYYVSCFCAIFTNTQKALIINIITGYVFSLVLYPFIIGLILCIMRYCALKSKKQNKECLYKASNILGDILL